MYFAGIEPSISESGIESHTGKMVKPVLDI